MTKFKKGDRVEITAFPDPAYNGFFGKVLSPLDQYGYVELALESVPVGRSEAWGQIGGFYVRPKEITLAKQETKVTEFKAGDVVRLIKGLNYFGEVVTPPTKEKLILGWIDPELSKPGEFDAWEVESGWGWVRSDDIELVSRPEKLDTKHESVSDDQLSHERLADSNEAKRRRLKKIKKKLKKLLKEFENVIVD